MAAAPLWRRVVCAVLLPAALVRAARPSGKCGADALPTKVPSSIAISPPFERDLPVCYASEPHGLGALSGNWRTDDSPEPPYWNLSCPFEWAKYSCVHQGNAGHAARARMRFELRRLRDAERRWCSLRCSRTNAHYWRLAHTAGPRSRVLYLKLARARLRESAPVRERARAGRADSLRFQVYLALGCLLYPEIRTMHLPWRKKDFPCHGTTNCISSGAHSGFDTTSRFELKRADEYAGKVDDSARAPAGTSSSSRHAWRCPRDRGRAHQSAQGTRPSKESASRVDGDAPDGVSCGERRAGGRRVRSGPP